MAYALAPVASFLLAPHAPTSGLAHLGACLAVARRLRECGHRCVFAYSGTRPKLIEDEGFELEVVPGVPSEREWTPREWFRDAGELEPVVDAHLRVIEELRPTVVISSNDVAGRLAAELRGVPRLHLMHYLAKTSYGRRATVWGDRRRDLRHPRRIWRIGRAKVLSAVRERGTPGVALAVAELRRRAGLDPAPREALLGCPDTAVALTTTPFLDPARGLPAHWEYVGPIVWSPRGDAWQTPHVDGLPLIYATQGSTGDPEHLRLAIRALAAEPVRVLAATGGLLEPTELESLAPNVLAHHLVPGEAAMRAADLAMVHGGHLTLSQALRAGTPVLIMPSRRDQIGRVNTVAKLGIGAGLYPMPRSPRPVRKVALRVLGDERVRLRSAELADALAARWDGARNAATLVERIAAGEDRGQGPERTAVP